MLVDAALGIFLLTGFYIAQTYHVADNQNEELAKKFGRVMSDVVHGIDRRIVLDGRELSQFDSTSRKTVYGNWNKDWLNQSGYLTMLNDELIAPLNSDCGKGALAKWVPKIESNNTAALIRCSTINADTIPFGLKVESRRESAIGLDHILSNWSVTVWHSDKAEFEASFKYYPTILESFKQHDVLQMAATHKAYYVDRNTGRQIKQGSSCYSLGTSCGLRFEASLSESEFDQEDGELRLDRAISLDDVTFRVSATSPEACYVPDINKSSGYREVNCGFDYDPESGDLSLALNTATASSYELILEGSSTQIGIQTQCMKDGLSDSIPCGLSVIESSGASTASLYVDELFTKKLRAKEIELGGDITVRESWDKADSNSYENKLTVGLGGVVKSRPSEALRSIEFDSNGLSVNSDNKRISSISKELNVNASTEGVLTTTSDKIELMVRNENGEDGTANLVTSAKQTSLMHSDYDPLENSPIATQAFALQGVRVASIETVASGGAETVVKRTCPASETGKRAQTQISVFPAKGFNTDIMNPNFDYGRCSITGYNNGTKTPAFNLRQVIGSGYVEGIFSVQCEMNRDLRIDYDYVDTGSVVYPRFYFDVVGKQGNGGNYDEISGVPMVVMQFCDYSKAP